MRKTYVIAALIALAIGLWLYSGEANKGEPVRHATLADQNLEADAAAEDRTPTRVRARISQAQAYVSSVLVHFVIPSHPVIFLVHIYSRCLGPAFSHAGFEKLMVGGTGVVDAADFHHQLHHRYFECNYGTSEIPFDKWFGTYHDGSAAATARTRAHKKQMYTVK